MRLCFTVSTLFLIIFFTNAQAFSEVQSESQEKVEAEVVEVQSESQEKVETEVSEVQSESQEKVETEVSEVQSESQEKVEAEVIEKYIELAPKYREASKMLYTALYEMLLETPWFESDADMSDAFVTRTLAKELSFYLLGKTLNFKTMIIALSYIPELSKRLEMIEQLKSPIKIWLNHQYNKEKFVDTITTVNRVRTRTENGIAIVTVDKMITQIIFKSEAILKEIGTYPRIDIPKDLPEKDVPGYIKSISDRMKKLNVKEIAIHSSFVSNIPFFIALAKEFQGKGIDVNILGYCFLDCAIYVSLMAENINITPYGMLAYGGFMPALDKDLSQAFKTSKDNYENKKDSVGGLANFIMNFFNDIKKRKQMEAFIGDKEQYLEVITIINNILINQSREFVNEAVADEILLLSKNQLEMLEELSYDLFNNLNLHTDSYKTAEQMAQISVTSQNVKNYFNSFENVKSKLDLTLFDFFSFTNDITKSYHVDLLYPNFDRKYYAGSERDKVKPTFVVPSTSLLRDLGFNVKGNNIIIGSMLPKEKFLKLNTAQIEKCEVFKENKNPLNARKCLEGFSE